MFMSVDFLVSEGFMMVISFLLLNFLEIFFRRVLYFVESRLYLFFIIGLIWFFFRGCISKYIVRLIIEFKLNVRFLYYSMKC